MKLIFRKNSLRDGYYIEPYAGGASIALSLLLNEYATRVIINDIDKSIYAFWHSILNKTDEFCHLIENSKLNIKTWEYQRGLQRQKRNISLLKLGFSTFYLNRTNRSGIINGGVIGGLGQTGKWKIDARFNKADLTERIRKIAAYKNRIDIYNLDAKELLKKIAPSMPQKSLFYLDPPYYIKGHALYVNHYKPKDHKSIANTIKRVKKYHWIVSYDCTPEITELYDEFRQLHYSINYSAAKAKAGKEVMIFSDNLSVPKIQNPITTLNASTLQP